MGTELPVTLTQDQYANLLKLVKDRIDKGGSLEGIISQSPEQRELNFETANNGKILLTIDNMLIAMRGTKEHDRIRYNVLTNCAEIVNKDGSVRRFDDADEAESRRLIQTRFKIHNVQQHRDALYILLRERQFNPIQQIVDNLVWDGKERCEHFLTKWAKADDTEYVHEVSRLIFAGGINRLYLPGCKFDDVPVLIGRQGGGKSTLVRWLAIHDSYFGEIKEISGSKAIEQLSGIWIGEVAELLALTKAKEQEDVKSYITTQRDRYRTPYARHLEELPRRCIFIGTTNLHQFLKDKTGNRRFYPVETHCNGYELFDHEDECRDYILQCWAEARDKYRKGEMPNYAKRGLWEQYQAAQEEAIEDDWRVGAIQQYLDSKPVGTCVCVRQLKREALTMGEDKPSDPSPKESQELTMIMNKFEDWEKGGRVNILGYGRQRCWKKIKGTDENSDAEQFDELPF